ncbi:hypothetical protein BDP27DRAFT_414708 [Rhodocollybia butyracea]|uniref:Uncharacterized protein n=1 Tax=Rhodocollybia butyracea TaxID=206335 RepID=A0A9P5Q0K0_9AGAR|nr:hypothetical protein BDP27DRAFT_414708 [Rhodocollybia butyracea]
MQRMKPVSRARMLESKYSRPPARTMKRDSSIRSMALDHCHCDTSPPYPLSPPNRAEVCFNAYVPELRPRASAGDN